MPAVTTTIKQPWGSSANTQSPLTTQNVGTVATNVTAVEHGDGVHHKTVLTVTNAVLPNIPGGANLAVGVLLYTLPAGVINVRSTYMSLAIQEVDSNINADTPDVGIGTVIATGVVTVLGGTATFEDFLTGRAADDCDGTAELAQVQTDLAIPAANAHTLHFNAADGWAASGDTGALVSGTVIIEWDFEV